MGLDDDVKRFDVVVEGGIGVLVAAEEALMLWSTVEAMGVQVAVEEKLT